MKIGFFDQPPELQTGPLLIKSVKFTESNQDQPVTTLRRNVVFMGELCLKIDFQLSIFW